MNPQILRTSRVLALGTIATAAVLLNSCCSTCCCSSKSRLLEDFWVSPDERIEWMQEQRAMHSGDRYDEIDDLDWQSSK